VRLLNLIQEHTREGLQIGAARHWSPAEVIGVLADVMVENGIPEAIRSDSS